MEIQPIVIGTAGHIDHGKSTLVRALTGTDPDRLKEEKERGLTIDLGFARMELEDGRKVGIVDVPGHERFIRNMVAGASGIDLVILVVAADDGVMPQTREHLSIMQILGVERGLIALNKVDLVDPELVELAAEDIRETVEGTFLEGAPVLHVSGVKGTGLDELRAKILEMASDAKPRPADGVFRMPVQRVFSARGVGTILTGIPVSGTVEVGTVLEVLPSGQKGKLRGIQAYHESSQTARAGHSSALNLADVDHKKVQRGDVVATPGFFKPLLMIGARLTALAHLDRPITNRMAVRVHAGTADSLGEIVLLDADEIAPGDSAMVQFRFEEPLVCAPGDRFVVRLASPALTLGGGVILEESRYRLKRFKAFVIGELERQAQSLGSPKALLEAQLARAKERWVLETELVHVLKRSKPETRALLDQLQGEGKALKLGKGDRWIHAEALSLSLSEVEDALESWLAENSMRQLVDVRELRRVSGIDASFLAVLLEEQERRGLITLESGGMIRPAGREIELDEETAALREKVLTDLRNARFQPPSSADLAAAARAEESEVLRVLDLVVDEGAVIRVGGALFIAKEPLDEARAAIVENCETNGQLEIPALRDRLGTTRKYLIPLLEYFDAQGVTLRQGGHRVLKRT